MNKRVYSISELPQDRPISETVGAPCDALTDKGWVTAMGNMTAAQYRTCGVTHVREFYISTIHPDPR